ncbi:MAG: TetR/AcrR family transcriptional regulator [Sphingomonadales bacterium]
MRPARYTEEEAKALILDAADKLIERYGFQKTTISDIAKECDFSASNVHKFFGTKSAIKQAIAERALGAIFTAGCRSANRQGAAADKIAAFIDAINKTTLTRFEKQASVFEGLAAASEEKWPVVRDYRLALLRKLEELIDLGNERGEFDVPNVKNTALAVHMSLFRLMHPTMIMEAIGEPDQGSNEIFIEFILRGLKSKA